MENRKQSFPPLECSEAEVLILGSIPGDKSIEKGEYYGHPQNRFWRVMSVSLEVELPSSYDEKIEMLRRGKIALWDVAHTAVRKGSLDHNISDVIPNDIPGFLEKYPTIHTVIFNGKKSEQLFNRYFDKQPDVAYVSMPSTSPANAAFSLEKLCCEWGDMFEGEIEHVYDGYNYFVKDIPNECPICRKGNVVEVLYGEPTPEAWSDHLNGKLMIGGCCICEDSPEHQCTVCGSGYSKEVRCEEFDTYQYYNGEPKNPFNKEEQIFDHKCWEFEQNFEKLYAKGDFTPELFGIRDTRSINEWNDIIKKGAEPKREPLYKVWLFNLLDHYFQPLLFGNTFSYILEQFSKKVVKPNFPPLESKYKSTSRYKKYLLSKCKIYNGNEEGLTSLGWYEQAWVERKLADSEDALVHITDYREQGLECFREYDGVPISLKALLFNRFMHWGGPGDSVETFKQWYVDAYVNRRYE